MGENAGHEKKKPNEGWGGSIDYVWSRGTSKTLTTVSVWPTDRFNSLTYLPIIRVNHWATIPAPAVPHCNNNASIAAINIRNHTCSCHTLLSVHKGFESPLRVQYCSTCSWVPILFRNWDCIQPCLCHPFSTMDCSTVLSICQIHVKCISHGFYCLGPWRPWWADALEKCGLHAPCPRVFNRFASWKFHTHGFGMFRVIQWHTHINVKNMFEIIQGCSLINFDAKNMFQILRDHSKSRFSCDQYRDSGTNFWDLFRAIQ